MLICSTLSAPGRAAPLAWRKAAIGLPFGLNVHQTIWNAPNEYSQIVVDAGIGWVRSSAGWDQIEATPGTFDWTFSDRLVDGAEQSGLMIFWGFGCTPAWATDGAPCISPARDVATWKAHVGAVVARYKDRIKYWEIWNEPNLGEFFTGTRAQFINDVFIPAADAIHAADPDAQVVGPGLAHLNSGDWDGWLNDMLTQAGDRIDVVSHHAYDNSAAAVWNKLDGPQWPWDPPNVRTIVTNLGHGDKPFWLTETGWNVTNVGEDAQAKDYTDFLDGMLSRPWFTRVFFYELGDDPRYVPKWGIARADLSRRPSFTAYQAFITGHTPVAESGGDRTIEQHNPLPLDGSLSHDPDNAIVAWEWDFDESDGVQVDASGAKLSHAFAEQGSFLASLTVRDATGLAVFQRFVVTVVPDVTAPTILAVSPAADAPAALDARVEVSFSEPMDPASMVALAIDPPIAGALAWDGTTLRLTPDAPLPPATAYIVTIDAGARDQSGNALAAPVSAGFTTTSLPPDAATVTGDGGAAAPMPSGGCALAAVPAGSPAGGLVVLFGLLVGAGRRRRAR